MYDGRTFQVLKKLFREVGRSVSLDILIVSAKHGVIRATRRISPTPPRACSIAIPESSS